MLDALEVAHVIHSIKDFVAALHEGDIFYWVSSRRSRPYAIEGPFKVLGFVLKGKEQYLNVKCSITHGRVTKIEYYSVNDLTNEYHGVFTNEDEARTYFREKQAAYDRTHPPAKK